MQHVFSIILLAVSSNIDNLGVAVAYGVRGQSIRLRANLSIALVSGSGTYLAMSAGARANDLLREGVANLLGSTILVMLGLMTIGRAMRSPSHDPRHLVLAPDVGARETTALALSLTLNNLGAGVGAGLSHLNVLLTTALTVVASIVTISAGQVAGRRLSSSLSRRTLDVVAGLVLVSAGVYEYYL